MTARIPFTYHAWCEFPGFRYRGGVPVNLTQAEDECLALLRDLIRLPTVNRGPDGPTDGHERPAAECIAEYLRSKGVEPTLYEPEPGRTSVVARLRGTGEKPPLLLNAHLDVVEADASAWTHPPFEAKVEGGYLWGRGTVDMKNMAAMSAVVMGLLAKGAAEKKLTRDVIFAGVADEEAGCAKGSMFLVNEHPDVVRAEYVLGEIGGFSLHMLGRTFYPIQVAEKGMCWVRATFRGEPGHGSMPHDDTAVLKLSRALARLTGQRFPMHPTAAVRSFVGAMAKELPQPQRAVLGQLTTPALASLILDRVIKDDGQRRTFSALLSNTATPTVLRAGAKTNVIPSTASVEIDGRTLPGQTEESFLAELRVALGKEGAEAEIDVIRSLPPVETMPDGPLFDRLVQTLRMHDPKGIPIPFVIPGFTDAKAYAKLGTRCFGFAPIRFDAGSDLSFSRIYHGTDERIPTAGLAWGLGVLFDAVAGFASE
jgi:acetylornithine deacetylase/succinyl-diaminopimelate desuccinylase-like protein